MSALKELNKKDLADFDDVEICIKQVEINWPIHAEIVESAARIYAILRKRTEWQPIETIPGRVVVLVYDADYGIIISQDIGGCVIGAKNPTHWMPLPELP